jgi:hypothetical protein
MCQAVDQLQQAVGDPTTSERSTAWQEFETALTGSDEEQLKAAANGVLGHLTDGSRAAQTASGFEPGSGAASEMQALQEGLAEGVRVLRDGTLAGTVSRVDEGRHMIDAAYEDHYEQALARWPRFRWGASSCPACDGQRTGGRRLSGRGVECAPLVEVNSVSNVGADMEHPRDPRRS